MTLVQRVWADGEGQHRQQRESRVLGGDPGVLGRTLTLNGTPVAVVGVMPPGFSFPPPVTYFNRMVTTRPPELYRSLSLDRSQLQRGNFNWFAVARLQPGVTVEQAGADLAAIAARIGEELGGVELDVNLIPFHQQSVATIRPSLLLLLAAVGLVLVIVCTNVASLALVRAATRQREIAVRLALGAGRGRIVSQLMTESLVLAAAGGVVGLGVAVGLTGAVVALSPIDLPAMYAPRLDLPVLGFTALVALVTGLACGIVPALRTSRLRLSAAMGAGGRGGSGGVRQVRARSVLVVGEVAVATMVLVGAGLVVRSYGALMQVDSGFRTEGMLRFGFFPAPTLSTVSDERRLMFERVLEGLRALSGVESAALTNHLPLLSSRNGAAYQVDGEPPPARGSA